LEWVKHTPAGYDTGRPPRHCFSLFFLLALSLAYGSATRVLSCHALRMIACPCVCHQCALQSVRCPGMQMSTRIRAGCVGLCFVPFV
jgi:hypothetical protein